MLLDKRVEALTTLKASRVLTTLKASRVSTSPTNFPPVVDEVEIDVQLAFKNLSPMSKLEGQATTTSSSVTTMDPDATIDPDASKYAYKGGLPLLRQPSPPHKEIISVHSDRDEISEPPDEISEPPPEDTPDDDDDDQLPLSTLANNKKRKKDAALPKHLDGCGDRSDPSSDEEEEKKKKAAPVKKKKIIKKKAGDQSDLSSSSDEEEEKKKKAAPVKKKIKKATKEAKKKQQDIKPKLDPKAIKLTAEQKNIRAKEAARLPFFLEDLTHGDLHKLVCADELWPDPQGESKQVPACVGFLRDKNKEEDQRFMGYVTLPDEVGGDLCDANTQVVVDIRFLLLTQWRQLVKNLNISALQNKGKAQIRFGLGQAQAQGDAFDMGESQRVRAEKVRTSSFLRLVNAISAPSHVRDFLQSNDRKARADHETGTTNKRYYQNLTDRYNDTEEDNDDILLIQFNDVDDGIAEEGAAYDLAKFTHKSTVEVRKMTRLLIKGRKVIRDNMDVSGTHSSDPWEFSDVAVKKIGGLAAFELVYFYRFCDDHNNEIDSSFSIGGSTEMTGDSVSRVESKGPTRNKTSAASELTKAMETHSQALCEQLKERNQLVSKGLDLDETKNEQATFFKCLEAAGDKNIATPLRKMAEKRATMIGVKYGWA
jgi:hypothetical protein